MRKNETDTTIIRSPKQQQQHKQQQQQQHQSRAQQQRLPITSNMNHPHSNNNTNQHQPAASTSSERKIQPAASTSSMKNMRFSNRLGLLLLTWSMLSIYIGFQQQQQQPSPSSSFDPLDFFFSYQGGEKSNSNSSNNSSSVLRLDPPVDFIEKIHSVRLDNKTKSEPDDESESKIIDKQVGDDGADNDSPKKLEPPALITNDKMTKQNNNTSNSDITNTMLLLKKHQAPAKNKLTIKKRATASTAKKSEALTPWNKITMPFPKNVTTTLAWTSKKFYSGYRNQMMIFKAIIMTAKNQGHGQVLVDNLLFKDTYGTNRPIRMDFLFDVENWNSFYPELPRLVHCEPDIFTDYICGAFGTAKFKDHDPVAKNVTKPYPFDMKQHRVFSLYMRYQKQKGALYNGTFPDPIDLLMVQKALRVHPELEEISQRLLRGVSSDHRANTNTSTTTATTKKSTNNTTNNNKHIEYMALHARVEPDMQRHPVCRDLKVLHLTKIVQDLELFWKDPPSGVTHVFLPVNRQYLEKEGTPKKKDNNTTNWIAVENLQELNRLSKEGMWGGRAKVFEFGSNALEGTKFASRPSTSGAVLNFHIAEQAKIFVGTEVSSWSIEVMGERFHKRKLQNYKYLPSGIHRWTNETTTYPQAFAC